MRLAGAIFDLDGTLVDTLPACYAAFRAACAGVGGPHFTDAEIRPLFGPSEEGMVQRARPERWPEALAILLDEYARQLAHCGAVFPAVEATLRRLRESAVPVALVTGKGPQTTAMSLRHFALDDVFAVVETGSPTGIVKAAAIRRVVEAWKVAPDEVIYVGDAVGDMHAAVEAGVRAVAAAWAPSAQASELAATRPHALFEEATAFESWIAGLLSPGAPSPARRRSGGSTPAR